MSQQNNHNPNRLFDTLIIIVSIVFIGIGVAFIRFYPSQSEQNSDIEEPVVLPEQEEPYTGTGGPDLSKMQTSTLFAGSYTPSQDVYSENSFRDQAIRIALNGEFEMAEIVVSGIVTNDLKNYISISFDGINGILHAARKNARTLDQKKTYGVFTKEGPIEFVIDMLNGVQLSTTKEEFLKTSQTQKDTSLLRDAKELNLPRPSITYFLIAPFTENGNYGLGSEINGITARWICKEDSNCGIYACKVEHEPGSLCIEEYFGETAEKQYVSQFR